MPTTESRSWSCDGSSSLHGQSKGWTAEQIETRHAGLVRYSGSGRRDVSLAVMFFDAYGFQRELSIRRVREPGASLDDRTRTHWTVSAYKHPFHPATETRVSEGVALRLIERIWTLATDYPLLLMNDPGEGTLNGQHSGLVRLHESLLAGARPSVDLLP